MDHILVLGGDRRQETVAKGLAAEGWHIHTYALGNIPGAVTEADLSAVGQADIVVLPMPLTTDGVHLNASTPVPLRDVFDRLTPEQLLFAGRVTPPSQEMAVAWGLTLLDYADREELAIANAVPTAEGAIQLAMEELPVTIHGTPVLVVGYGRVGSAVARRFAALGAQVTVAARRAEQRAMARADGMSAVSPEEMGGPCRLILNTVPAPILTRRVLERFAPPCLILDLASHPGGTDRTAAEKLGFSVIHALALPGRVAPETAGAAIKDTLLHMLRELGR